MGRKKSVEQVNRFLRGSPYLLPDDELGENIAASVVKRMRNLENRVRRLDARVKQRHSDVMQQILNDVVVRQVYESNALEGLGPSLKDTYDIISERGRRTVRDILRDRTMGDSFRGDSKLADVAGLHDAYTFAEELAKTEDSIREVDLRNLHALITSHEPFAGDYKRVEVEIGGSSHTPTPTYDVQRAMGELTEWINKAEIPPSLAATVGHAWLTHVHPFQDGNGRTARILANLLLARSGYPALVIKSRSDKGEYLEALAHSDQGGDILVFFDLVVKALNRAAYEMETPEVMRRLIQEDLFPGENSEYQAWMTHLASVTASLNNRLPPLGYRFEVVGGLEASDFSLLRSRSASGNAWFAKVRRRPHVSLLLWFGFSTSEMMDSGYIDRVWPSIFFSERDMRPLVEHPYRPLMGSGRLPIDEITIVPGRKLGALVRNGRSVRRTSIDELPDLLADALDAYEARSELRRIRASS